MLRNACVTWTGLIVLVWKNRRSGMGDRGDTSEVQGESWVLFSAARGMCRCWMDGCIFLFVYQRCIGSLPLHGRGRRTTERSPALSKHPHHMHGRRLFGLPSFFSSKHTGMYKKDEIYIRRSIEMPRSMKALDDEMPMPRSMLMPCWDVVPRSTHARTHGRYEITEYEHVLRTLAAYICCAVRDVIHCEMRACTHASHGLPCRLIKRPRYDG